MKVFYMLTPLLLLCLACAVPLQVDPLRGYIITKNGRQLTGYIGEIFQGSGGSTVVFINDFGSEYHIHAALIRGFVFRKGEEYVAYESVRVRQARHFLRILERGAELSLYQAPEVRTELFFTGGNFQVRTYEAEEFWLQFQDKKLTRIRKAGFRNKMRRLLSKTAPELSEKIGEAGYKFQDLPGIVREYNRVRAQRKWTI